MAEKNGAQRLNLAVTAAATQLMAVDAATAAQVSQRVLADLVGLFDVDVSFLRHNDHRNHTSNLIAEWPPRPIIPDPDPLGVIHFAEADPIFAALEHGREPVVVRPQPEDYRRRIEAGGGIPVTSIAAAPLLSGEVTTGALGFIKFDDREWTLEEITAVEAIASLFAQVQARIAAEEHLRYLADHDDLTGLYNRRALIEHLSARLGAGQPVPVTVCFLDLDRLKAINDYLGYTAGDWFIQVVAQRLREQTESRDFIARFGGDEFVVVLASPVNGDAAESLANQLHSAMTKPVTIAGDTYTRTVSIGVTTGTPGQDTTTDLLRQADRAVLAAKNAGGNTIAMFSGNDVNLDLRNDIELNLQAGIENDALVLHYLPEVDMRTGEILATEALVRWQHPTRGLLSPDAFIGVAESINLAGDLGRWVLRNACSEFARWRSHGVGATAILRVNISPIQLVSDRFVDSVADVIAEFGLNGDSVCLEITEHVMVQDIEATRKTLTGLKDVGVQIAIDDFGTGHSILSHLKSLPVDTLKIDRGFVRELGVNADDLAIVRAIIALAEAFGLQIVAEGVETEAAAATLLKHGCHRAQGFLLSRPVGGDAMESLLANRRIPLHF